MGSLIDKPRPKVKRLRRNEQDVSYRDFPIKRKHRDEYHVHMGFASQAAAEEWIDWGIKDRFLTPTAKNAKKGLPKKP